MSRLRPAGRDDLPPLVRAAYWLQYAGPRLAISLLLGLGDPMLRSLSKVAGRLAFRIDARHRTRAEEHLVLAGYPQRRARQIARKMFEHFAVTVTEGLVLRRRLRADNWRKYVRFENLPLLDDAVKSGRGGLLIGCHQGAWELGGIALNLIGYPLTIIARPFRNPFLDRFLNGARSETGGRILRQAGGVGSLIREVRNGRVGVILADQNAGKDAVFVPFFGRPASTWPTAALISLKTGATILPFYSYREAPFRYVFGVHPDPAPPKTGRMDEDVQAITAWYTALFERSIRERPEQWLWAHRRWKSRQRGAGAATSGR